jgi:hypothetical protein
MGAGASQNAHHGAARAAKSSGGKSSAGGSGARHRHHAQAPAGGEEDDAAARPTLLAALRAGGTPEEVLRAAAAAAVDGELSPSAASAALQRLATLLPRGGAALKGDARFSALCAHVQRATPSLRPRTLANVLFAFGALAAPPDADWLRRAEGACAGALHTMGAEDAANAIWGLTVCGHRPSDKWLRTWDAVWLERMTAAAAAAAAAAADGSAVAAAVHPQAIERALWACGTLAHSPGRDALALTAAAAARVARAAPPGALAHTLWALAVLRAPPAPREAADLAAAAAAKFTAATPGELVTTFWVRALAAFFAFACARAGTHHACVPFARICCAARAPRRAARTYGRSAPHALGRRAPRRATPASVLRSMTPQFCAEWSYKPRRIATE